MGFAPQTNRVETRNACYFRYYVTAASSLVHDDLGDMRAQIEGFHKQISAVIQYETTEMNDKWSSNSLLDNSLIPLRNRVFLVLETKTNRYLLLYLCIPASK